VLLGRAWAAGGGPGDSPVIIDVDSTICETYGLNKHGGAKFTDTHVRGYHPLIAAVAGTGDLVHHRLRGANANTARGAAGFLTETFNRARTAGAAGPLTLRADSGFYTGAVAAACRRADVKFSITAKMSTAIRSKVTAIASNDWTAIAYFLDSIAGGDSTTSDNAISAPTATVTAPPKPPACQHHDHTGDHTADDRHSGRGDGATRQSDTTDSRRDAGDHAPAGGIRPCSLSRATVPSAGRAPVRRRCCAGSGSCHPRSSRSD
jgi:hypothetical protein